MADRAGDGHEDEHKRNGDDLKDIVPIDVLEAAEHEDADIDKCGARCRSRDESCDRRDEHAKKEHDRGGQRGKTRAAAGLNAGAGLDEGGDGGGAGACACYGADGVCQQSFLHLGHFAVLVEHVCACGGADEGADGVEHVDHAEGDDKGNGGEPADAYEGLEIKLEEGGVEHIAERGNEGCGGQGLKRIGVQENEAAAPVNDAGDEHAENDGCLDLVVAEDDDGEYADEHGDNVEHQLRIRAADGVARYRRGEASEEGGQNEERAALFAVKAGVRAEADVEQHKADGRGDADADAEGNGLNDLLADGEKREDDEENALDEDDAHCGREGFLVAQAGERCDVCNDDGEEAVQAHAGSHCKGLVRGEGHDEHADRGGYARCHEYSVPQRSAGREVGQQVGVEGNDISHCHEGGKTGDYLCARGGAVFLQLEDLFHFALLFVFQNKILGPRQRSAAQSRKTTDKTISANRPKVNSRILRKRRVNFLLICAH